jgi:crossover junction endodeoxyribonuclease RusA
VILLFPIPPSSNNLYANSEYGGRFKSKKYKAWLKSADRYYWMQKAKIKPVFGACVIRIKVPQKMRGDISNRIKALEDYLVSRKITGDDKNNSKVSIERANILECEIEIIGETA